MRVLLDECLPRRLGRELQGHVVSTVQQAGWSGIKNGALLALAAKAYDVFITIDRLLATQHGVPANLAVVTLHAPANTIAALRPLLPALLDALAVIQPGETRRLGV